MEHLSKSLYNLNYAYKNQTNKAGMVKCIDNSIAELTTAQEALLKTQHGIFEKWYDSEKGIPRYFQLLKELRIKALNK